MARSTRPALLGRKLGMTQLFADDGTHIPVTVLEVGPCPVIQIKTVEKDGYTAWKVGFGATKKKAVKPLAGVFAKAGVSTLRLVREVPPVAGVEVKPGDALTVKIFEKVKRVDVVGTCKGRGFSGTMRKWNFQSGPRAHGSKNVREIGSVGPGYVCRIIPGKKMPGHWGAERSMVLNLALVKIDAERNVLWVRGAVPGPRGGYVMVRESARGR